MTGRTQVPDSWLVARLGDVADWVNGLAFRDIQFSEIGKPIIRIAELKAGITTETKFTNQCFDQSVHIRQGDLLFAWSGQPETSINSFWWNGPEGWLNQHIFRVTTRPQVNTTFFYYLLRHLNSVFVRIARGKQTAGLGHVTKEELFKMVAAFPPMWEQKAIAAALGGVDEAIERTEEVIAATERLRDALLHELLTRGVPGQHSEWKEAPGIGTIPACWDVVRLGDVVESTTYGTNASLDGSGSTPVLRMGNLQNGHIDLSELRQADLSDRDFQELNLVRGDILFNRTNSLALVGKVAVVRDLPQPISFASYLVRLRIRNSRVDPFWLAALLLSPSCQSRIRQFATPGVSQANINPTSLKSLTIPLPCLSEQRAMAVALDGMDEAIEQARRERDGLQMLKSSVADALLTGRVRIKEPVR